MPEAPSQAGCPHAGPPSSPPKAGGPSTLSATHLPPFVKIPLLAVPHGFYGSVGGVSQGIYSSLNCGLGSADDASHVAENRARVAASLDLSPACLLSVHQVHSAEAVVVTAPWSAVDRPRADALVTDRPGLGLGILAADCTPVLFADAARGIIGAAHAGWRGAFSGVLEATLRAMRALGAGEIHAAIGPAIRQPSYEVGPEFLQRFLDHEGAAAGRWFVPSDRVAHARFDLTGYVRHRLVRADVAGVVDTGIDTYPAADSYFSYRRATHRGESDYGRNISVVCLPA